MMNDFFLFKGWCFCNNVHEARFIEESSIVTGDECYSIRLYDFEISFFEGYFQMVKYKESHYEVRNIEVGDTYIRIYLNEPIPLKAPHRPMIVINLVSLGRVDINMLEY